MTRAVKCRTVERLLIEGEDRSLLPEEQRIVEGHLRGCGPCREFAAERALIRNELGSVLWPSPPVDLVTRTRRIVREAAAAPREALPAWVLVALAAVTAATAAGLAISLADVRPDMTLADLPAVGLAAVFVIFENALTLLFAPVVLRSARARRDASESAR